MLSAAVIRGIHTRRLALTFERLQIMSEEKSLTVFDQIKAEMDKIREHNQTVKFDYENPKENKLARSHIFALRKVKSRIADAHKQAKADILEAGRVIDGLKRDLTAEVDAMIEVHDAPIREIEQREAKAAAEEAARIQAEKEAEERRIREEQEAKQRELEERERIIREKEEAQRRAEREAQIAKEAEERAQQKAKEAQEQAKRDAEAAIAREKAEAERRVIEERQRAEKALEEERAKVERERKEAERKAAEEKRIAEEKERARIAKEQARIADEKHRTDIKNQTYRDLIFFGINDEMAISLVVAIDDGKIRNVKIIY